MEKVFTFTGDVDGVFVLFSKSHNAAMLVILALIVLMYLNRKKMAEHERRWRIFLGSALIVQEIVLHINRLVLGTWSLDESLPLHMCSLSVILIAVLFATESRYLFEVLYFWGIAGAVQAILTPNLDQYVFPHFRYYQFFLSHGLIMFSTLFMVFVKGWLPEAKSILRSLLFTNLILPFIGIVNWLTGGNYFFIARTPDTASIIDMMGPWPWYILVLEVVALVMFTISYLPVMVYKLRQKRRSRAVNV